MSRPVRVRAARCPTKSTRRSSKSTGPEGALGRRLPRMGSLPRLVLAPMGAKFVVLLAFLGVTQDLVRLVDRLKSLFGFLIIRIHVRMIFARQFSVGGL